MRGEWVGKRTESVDYHQLLTLWKQAALLLVTYLQWVMWAKESFGRTSVFAGEFPCPVLDLQLTGNYLCG